MKSTLKAVGIVTLIMFSAKIMSLLTSIAYTSTYGINIELEVYSYAVQLPTLIFVCIGTALTTIVLPIFAGYIGTDRKDKAFNFANKIITLSLLTTIILVILCIAASPLIVQLTRFRIDKYWFAVKSLAIMFPIMIFFTLSYIFEGMLQSSGKYYMPAVKSLPGSLIIISYVLFLGEEYGVGGLIIATFIGFSSQALILLPSIIKIGYRFRPSFDYKDEDIKRSLRLLFPIIIGTSAYQLNMIFSFSLAANTEGGTVLIDLIHRIIIQTVSAFSLSVIAVMFPKFTVYFVKKDIDGFKRSFRKVISGMMYILIPAATGFVLLRYNIINFLYGWGKVTADDVTIASIILGIYSFGIIGIALKETSDRAFYSMKNTITSALNGLLMMGINIVVCLSLFVPLGVLAIPVGFLVSSTVGGINIIVLLNKKIGDIGKRKIFNTVIKIAFSSGIMFVLTYVLMFWTEQINIGNTVFVDKISGFIPQETMERGMKLIIPVIFGMSVYFVATYLMKVEESKEISSKIKNTVRYKIFKIKPR